MTKTGMKHSLKSGFANKQKRGDLYDLFLISFVSLYLEILLIRWLAANIRLLAYFTNITLIAAFFGLSLGCLLAKRKINLFAYWPLLFALLMSMAWFFGRANIFPDLKGRAFFYVVQMSGQEWPISLVIFIFYLLIVSTFIPLGQRLGHNLTLFQPVIAYSVNVLGSIAGVALFALFSFTGWNSYVWFGLLFLILFLLRSPFRYYRYVLLGLAIITLLLVFELDPKSVRWSPYHKIHTAPIRSQQGLERHLVGHQLFINRDLYQFILDLSGNTYFHEDSYLSMWQEIYETPYKMVQANEVLIVGAGTGNDVAAGLRMGVSHIDAVDIDPEIIKLGQELHPEQPYADPRVTISCQDARVFLRDSDKQYDLIVMGFLDSQTLFANMSNIRLDSFIYTREAFTEVRNHLKPEGVLACCFAISKPWLTNRLHKLIVETFHVPPLIFCAKKDTLFLFAVRKNGAPFVPFKLRNLQLVTLVQQQDTTIPITTDNWPFFYISKRTVPLDYMKTLGLLLLLSLGLIFLTVPRKRLAQRSMFFLGAGFLLLETLSITKLSLLYGSTWIVSAVVIVGFLVAILGANMFVLAKKLRSLTVVYILLLLSVALNSIVPVNFFLAFPMVIKFLLSSLLFCFPVFCAGIIFATLFHHSSDVQSAFGANTLGAVLGGFLEYLTLYLGFQLLYIVVIAVYLLSWPRKSAS
ncbi:methyltransferase domain-containing protein [candidate division CSSED10-310 bacterium]|uniref:Methyltransferase domain-containing protein n=1 Tax=candidate division CSSED10-310 bacterium TaxID=2855610 RepID=A0ABV6YTL1_UNCC1